jgi:hypothetical protein
MNQTDEKEELKHLNKQPLDNSINDNSIKDNSIKANSIVEIKSSHVLEKKPSIGQ